MSEKTIGYGIVGTGYFGAELARAMKKTKGLRLFLFLTRKTERRLLKN
ncbi:putative dehydrogenase [Staphylococcus schleiferi]